jgi:glycosyltransferase involved in cell wall biosynthesis
MENPKILFLATDLFSKGGITRYVRYQLRALKEVIGSGSIKLFSFLPPRGDEFEGDFHVDYIQGSNTYLNKVLFLIKSIFFVKQNKINLIISDHVRLAFIGFLAKKILGIPFWLNVYGIEVWKDLPFLTVMSLKGADHIVSDCDFTKQFLVKKYHIAQEKITVIVDCVDAEKFQPKPKNQQLLKKFSIPATDTIVLTVSRINKGRSKGHDKIIKALSQIKNRFSNVTYLVVGNGSDRENLEALAKNVGLENKVIFVGDVTDEQLYEFYNLCDIFALPSFFSLDRKNPQGEGVPLVILEACICAKPAIGSKMDGSAESIDHGKTGFLVDPSSVEEIANSFEKFFVDPQSMVIMGQAAREKVLKEFTYPIFKDKFGILVENFKN